MKSIFLRVLVIFSILYGLECHPRRKDGDITYYYHGGPCEDCPESKVLDVKFVQPYECESEPKKVHQKYRVETPKTKPNDEDEYDDKNYTYDVKFERPASDKKSERNEMYDYRVQVPKSKKSSEERHVHYVYDARIEQVDDRPCKKSSPRRELIAKVDRISMPACKDPSHSSNSCRSCGFPHFRMFGQTSENVPIYALPDDDSHSRVKRSASPSGLEVRRKSLEIKLPKLKPKDCCLGGLLQPKNKFITKETKIVTRGVENQNTFLENLKSQWNLAELKRAEKDVHKETRPFAGFKLPEITNEQLIDLPFLKLNEKRLVTRDIKMENRQPLRTSPCGYSFESCDPKVHNKEGCPLCYKCLCEPTQSQSADAKFSHRDIKIPYKVVSQSDSPQNVPTKQEFDDEPAGYIGLRDREMYNKYIKQVIEKYPEHMSRNMPDLQDQQQDLMKFIGELSKSKSPGEKMDNEDVRYKLIDNALDMYKQYEKAINALPKAGKPLKRESLLEIVPLDHDGKSYAIKNNDFDELVSTIA